MIFGSVLLCKDEVCVLPKKHVCVCMFVCMSVHYAVAKASIVSIL